MDMTAAQKIVEEVLENAPDLAAAQKMLASRGVEAQLQCGCGYDAVGYCGGDNVLWVKDIGAYDDQGELIESD